MTRAWARGVAIQGKVEGRKEEQREGVEF